MCNCKRIVALVISFILIFAGCSRMPVDEYTVKPVMKTAPGLNANDKLLTSDEAAWVADGTEASLTRLLQRYKTAKYLYNEDGSLQAVEFPVDASFGGLESGVTLQSLSDRYQSVFRIIDSQIAEENNLTTILKQMLPFDLISEPLPKLVGWIKLDGCMLVTSANSLDEPGDIALLKTPMPDTAYQMLLGGFDVPLTGVLYLSEGQQLELSSIPVTTFDLYKKTSVGGMQEVAEYYVPTCSRLDGFFLGSSFTWVDLKAGQTGHARYLLDGSPEDQFLTAIDGKNVQMGSLLTLERNIDSIIVLDTITEQRTVLPIPANLLSRLNNLKHTYEFTSLVKLSRKSFLDKAGVGHVALQAAFAIETDENGLENRLVSKTIAEIQFRIVGDVVEILQVIPTYTKDQADMETGLSWKDCRIGPFSVYRNESEMIQTLTSMDATSEELRLFQEGMDRFDDYDYEGKKVPESLWPQFRGFRFRTPFEYDIITTVSYSGSEENWKTPAGIGIGSTEEEVLETYGTPDEKNLVEQSWKYFISVQETGFSMEEDSIDNRLEFIFKDGKVERITCQMMVLLADLYKW